MKSIKSRIQQFLTGSSESQGPVGFQKVIRNHFKSFAFFWRDSFSRQPIQTNEEIKFSNYFGFGSHIDFVRRLTGKPSSSFENEELGTVVMMYLIEIHGFKVNFELHFYDEKLFCINYKYNSINDEEREATIRSLTSKYKVDADVDATQSIIIDPYGNGLLIESGNYFSVNYLSPNSKVGDLVKDYLGEHKSAV